MIVVMGTCSLSGTCRGRVNLHLHLIMRAAADDLECARTTEKGRPLLAAFSLSFSHFTRLFGVRDSPSIQRRSELYRMGVSTQERRSSCQNLDMMIRRSRRQVCDQGAQRPAGSSCCIGIP